MVLLVIPEFELSVIEVGQRALCAAHRFVGLSLQVGELAVSVHQPVLFHRVFESLQYLPGLAQFTIEVKGMANGIVRLDGIQLRLAVVMFAAKLHAQFHW